MKALFAQIPAAILCVCLCCSLAMARDNRRWAFSSISGKQTRQRATPQRPAPPDQTGKKVNCDPPPMEAETEAALKAAGRSGDLGKLREMVRIEIRRSPDVCGWYALFVATGLRSLPDNDADLDELLSVINEYQRRKLSGYNDAYVLMAKRAVYRGKSDLAIAQGDFDQGIASLRKLALLGGPESKAQSNLHIGFAYLRRYVKTQSRSDAAIIRDELRTAFGNPAGMEKVLGNDNGFLANLRMLLGAMENDLGNYAAAVRELELAQSLDPANPEVPGMLKTAKENVQGGRSKGVRFVSIQDILDALSPPRK